MLAPTSQLLGEQQFECRPRRCFFELKEDL